jgi:hypothetical protein
MIRPYGIAAQIAAVRQCIARDEDILRSCRDASPTRRHLEVMRRVLATLEAVEGVTVLQAPFCVSLHALYAAAEHPRVPSLDCEDPA